MSTNTKLADPCLALWQAMNEAEKVGNRTDDKLIVKFLREAGYGIAPLAAHDAEQAQESDPISDAFKAGMAAMEYAIWEGKEPCPCRKHAAQAVPAGKLVRELNSLLCGVSDCLMQEHGRGAAIGWAKECEAMLRKLAVPAAPAPQAHAAGQEERAALDKWFQDFRHGWKSEKDVAFDAWQARAALAQRQPLTWEQIESIRAQVLTQALQLRDGCDDQTWDHWFACAIEAAHGIGATTGEQR